MKQDNEKRQVRTVTYNGRTYTGEFWEDWLEHQRMVEYADSLMAKKMGMTKEQYAIYKAEESGDWGNTNPFPTRHIVCGGTYSKKMN